MIHRTVCDYCGQPLDVSYTGEQIQSLASCGIDYKALPGRHDACDRKVQLQHRYVQPDTPAPSPKAAAAPLSAEDVRSRIPLKALTPQTQKSAPARRIDESAAGYISPDLF